MRQNFLIQNPIRQTDGGQESNPPNHWRTRIQTQLVLISVLIIVILSSLISCSPREVLISGRTMGTTYSVKIVAEPFQSTDGLQEKIDKRLDEINQSMSTYRKDSEISRFNRHPSVDEGFPISDDFFRVLTTGRKIFESSGGAWDATVDPLVNLWGFGRKKSTGSIPAKAQISKALQTVGFDKIRVKDQNLFKSNPDVTLDLGSIAKGYGVDQIAAVVGDSGFDNFLVEIGGEVFAKGYRIDGKPWRVGVNRPQKEAPRDAVYKVVSLTDRAMATSGDYRNYIEIEGRLYSHVIDPRTGWPVANGVVSATVLAPNCTLADGLATALMVMGPRSGLEMIHSLQDVECLIIVMKKDGTLVDYFSKGFGTGD